VPPRLTTSLTLAAAGALLMVSPVHAQMQHGGMHPGLTNSVLLGMLELPFLGIALFYSLRTASAMRGGIFGRGMALVAGGMLVMGIGHFLMLADSGFGIDVLTVSLGPTWSGVAWIAALVASWGLTGTGFHSIYKASRA
jgi:hypothetical protein